MKGGEEMKIWKAKLLFAVVFSVSLYLANTSQANSLHHHEGHDMAAESSPDHETIETKVPAGKLPEVRALKNTVAVNDKTLSEAREIFTGKGTCANCHGEKGRGDGEIASSFSPPPRDFTYIKWQKVRTDGEIFWAITNGTESGMPSFGDMLNDEEKWGLVGYIRELGKKNSVASN
jgi:mono/diheme cytochrome c family protein